jgi:hypothetical protein
MRFTILPGRLVFMNGLRHISAECELHKVQTQTGTGVHCVACLCWIIISMLRALGDCQHCSKSELLMHES